MMQRPDSPICDRAPACYGPPEASDWDHILAYHRDQVALTDHGRECLGETGFATFLALAAATHPPATPVRPRRPWWQWWR